MIQRKCDVCGADMRLKRSGPDQLDQANFIVPDSNGRVRLRVLWEVYYAPIPGVVEDFPLGGLPLASNGDLCTDCLASVVRVGLTD